MSAEDPSGAPGSPGQGSKIPPATVNVTAPLPSKGKFSSSSIRSKIASHVRNSSKGSINISTRRHSNAARDAPPIQATSSPYKAADTSIDHTMTQEYTHQSWNTGSNPLAPLIPLIVTSITATSFVSILLFRIHWSLAFLTVATAAYMLQHTLISRGDDILAASRIATNEAKWNQADKVESVEWMNHILGIVWPLITADIFLPFIDLLEDALQLQVPGIVHAVRVEDVDQGVIPLKIEKFKVLGRSEDDFLGGRSDGNAEDGDTGHVGVEENIDLGEHVNLEIDFFYRAPPQAHKGVTVMTSDAIQEGIGPEGEQSSSTSETPARPPSNEFDGDTPSEMIHMLLYLSVGLQKIAAVEIPVWCEVLGIQGKMRLRVQLIPNAPFVKHVGFTLMGQPKLELKAKPLGRKMIIDAMQLPFLSSYVLKSIQTTVAPFVSPGSYTMDVAALLGSESGPRNTYSVGVICVILHQASDLPAADSNGYSDPFVSISFARAGKPLFRSRVLTRTLKPTWQEVAFILVSLDEIRDHEKLRFTIFDADRFSADDPLGKVEVSVDHLIHRALQRSKDFKSSTIMETRTDDLQPVRRGGSSKGRLKYSIVFSRLVQPKGSDEIASTPRRAKMIREAMQRAKKIDQKATSGKDEEAQRESREADKFVEEQEQKFSETDDEPEVPTRRREPEDLSVFETGFDRFVRSLGLPMDESLLKARQARHTRVRKLVDTLSGEQAAIFDPPNAAWPTGILAFHVHSIQQLEVSQPQRSLKSANLATSGATDSAAGTSGVGESMTPASRLPSSYVQVLLNDEPVLKTRTKTYNARPFINAGSERMVGDFRMARIDFVVRDSRQREADPILGIVGFKVSDILKTSARKTDWYTLTGGLGYGKMQITLLWRSVHLQVPASLRGWNIGVLEVSRLQASISEFFEGKDAYVSLQVPGGKVELGSISPKWDLDSSSHQSYARYDAEVNSRTIRLPVRQRYPGNLVITIKAGARTPGRRRPQVVLCTSLSRLVDNAEASFRAPLWISQDWSNVEQGVLQAISSDRQLFEGGRTEEEEEDYHKIQQEGHKEISALEELCRGGLADLPEELTYDGGKLQRAGFVDLTLHFFNGLAEEHRSLTAGDLELRVAHEAWQTMVDCKERGMPKRATGGMMLRGRSTSSASATVNTNNNNNNNGPAAGTSLYEPSIVDLQGEEEDIAGDQVESTEDRMLRKRILHRQERGAAQVKAFRTATWLKQNINDGLGRAKRLAGEQSKRLGKMEDEGVSSL